MSLLQQQINNEYAFAKNHTVENIQSLLPEINPYVEAYTNEIINHYAEDTEFSYTTRDGETKQWETKRIRYEYVREMPCSKVRDISWNIVVATLIKPSTTFTEVLGKIYKKFELGTERMMLETASEFIALLKQTPFVKFEYPKNSETGVLMIHSQLNLPDSVNKYLNNRRFVLPSVITPTKVRNNSDSGYITIKDGIILGGKKHTFNQNLGHINRANSVALRVDDRVPRMIEPIFKEDASESVTERNMRYAQWFRLNVECVQLLAELTDQDLYLTHRYDERGRTYARGHHINTQGDDYRKAMIELANRELVEM